MQVSEYANAMGRAKITPPDREAEVCARATPPHTREHHNGDDDNDWSHYRYATLSIKNAEKDTGGRTTG